jgi:hypothetical protein
MVAGCVLAQFNGSRICKKSWDKRQKWNKKINNAL